MQANQLKIGVRKSAAILMRIGSYMGPKRKIYLLGWALTLCELATSYITPYLYQKLADIATLGQSPEALRTIVLLFAVLLAMTPLVVLGAYQKSNSAAYGAGEMRKAVFRHVQRLPMRDLRGLSQGDFVTRLTGDVTSAARVFISYVFTGMFKFVFYIPISLAILWMRDWRFGLAGTAMCMVSLIVSVFLNPRIRRMNMLAREMTAQSTSFLMETLRAAPIIRVFLLAKSLTRRYKQMAQAVARGRFRSTVLAGVSEALVYNMISDFAQPVGFLLGITLVIRGEMDIGQAIFLSGVMVVMTDGLRGFSSFTLHIQPSLVAAKRVFDVLDMPAERHDARTPPVALQAEYAIELKDVGFSYQPGQPILAGLNLCIRKGEYVALVGSSGGGKTTVLRLIAGLYPLGEGSLRLYGQDAQTLGLQAARALISYVPQGGSIYDCSIVNNIRFGKQDATMEEVIAAARKAHIHDFIMSLPQGYDTEIGERGSQISGGQRQRIAIARAILKDAPILLLDEATASLDTDTELSVQAALEELIHEKTIVAVAHRLSTVKNADRMVTISEGMVDSDNPHDFIRQFVHGDV